MIEHQAHRAPQPRHAVAIDPQREADGQRTAALAQIEGPRQKRAVLADGAQHGLFLHRVAQQVQAHRGLVAFFGIHRGNDEAGRQAEVADLRLAAHQFGGDGLELGVGNAFLADHLHRQATHQPDLGIHLGFKLGPEVGKFTLHARLAFAKVTLALELGRADAQVHAQRQHQHAHEQRFARPQPAAGQVGAGSKEGIAGGVGSGHRGNVQRPP